MNQFAAVHQKPMEIIWATILGNLKFLRLLAIRRKGDGLKRAIMIFMIEIAQQSTLR